MKKILAFLIVLCMLASTLCIPAFAANDPAASTVLRIKALKNDGSTVVVLKDEDSFEDGWNYAIEQAVPKSLNSNGYKRIIVDFYGNWNANANGEFGDDDGDGFDNTTIYFPDDVKITLNMNGHTINRGLKEWIDDGEVMYINDDADVIINDGTITGGWSANGAGGIHVKDDVKLTLNNVHIIGNTADDADGGGIALGDDTELIMNGGSFKDNRLIGFTKEDCGGAIYMDDSVATFNNVEFKNNLTPIDENYGAVIYAEDSQVTLNNCTFEGNGLEASYNKFYLPIIYTKDSTLTVSGCTFNNNRSGFLLDVNHSILNVSNSVFTGITDTNEIIDPFYSSIYVTNTVFSDNNAYVISVDGTIEDDSFFSNCTFKNTKGTNGKTFGIYNSPVTFYDCDFGDSIFDISDIKIVNSPVREEDAVIGISGLFADGNISFTEYYNDAKTGWDAAMVIAQTNVYDRIAVDLYADWNADASVPYAVTVPENTKVTLNMNGYTIKAVRSQDNVNGEVIYIGVAADVIINDGTITGGFSSNGAGGIHIKDNANVVLNNVNLVKNATGFSANGGAIAMYGGSILTMNGGSISKNSIYGPYACGILYVKEAIATLNNVTISENHTDTADSEGLAIYADESTVTLNNCVVSGNATDKIGKYAESVVAAFDSKLIISNTDLTGNGAESSFLDTDYSHLFYMEDGSLTMEGGKITGNKTDKLFYFENSKADMKGVSVTDNASVIFDVDNDIQKVTVTECVLDNNSPVKYDEDIIVATKDTLVLIDCTLGDTVFENKNMVMFSNKAVGSIFGQGSLVMIVAILALIVSVVSTFIVVDMKKKLAPVASNNAAEIETEDEE